MELGEFDARAHHPQGGRHAHQRVDQIRPMDHEVGMFHLRHGQVGGEHHITAFCQALAEAVIKMVVGFKVVPDSADVFGRPVKAVLADDGGKALVHGATHSTRNQKLSVNFHSWNHIQKHVVS